MTLLHAPGDAYTLINELAEPVPRTLRGKFFEKVRALLSGDDILAPAKIVEVCQKVQIELMIAPAVDQERPQQPSKQPVRSPFRRRG
jgi:hypothetical protein